MREVEKRMVWAEAAFLGHPESVVSYRESVEIPAGPWAVEWGRIPQKTGKKDLISGAPAGDP